MCCQRKMKTFKNYVWRYSGDDFGDVIIENGNNTNYKIYKYDLNGIIQHIYNNTTEIADEYKLKLSQVRNYIKKHKCIDNQYVLFYEYTDFNYDKISFQKERRINRYDSNNNYIDTYMTASEAGRILNIDNSSILKCCHKKTKSYYKNYWYFVNDLEQPDKDKIII